MKSCLLNLKPDDIIEYQVADNIYQVEFIRWYDNIFSEIMLISREGHENTLSLCWGYNFTRIIKKKCNLV